MIKTSRFSLIAIHQVDIQDRAFLEQGVRKLSAYGFEEALAEDQEEWRKGSLYGTFVVFLTKYHRVIGLTTLDAEDSDGKEATGSISGLIDHRQQGRGYGIVAAQATLHYAQAL